MSGPLDGITVLELGGFIAGPFAGQLLADYGATVIKIEPPGAGDPMRRWGVTRDGDSLWWPAIARNKKSVAIDVRRAEGAELVRRMARRADVVLENFRPGAMKSWGLDYETLSASSPSLVMAHVSGYGQSGPRSAAAGFGAIGEAMGGIRHTTGEPDRPAARSGISLGDALAGLFATLGVLAALHERERSGRGQEVDVAIYEAVLALMESTMADYEVGGVVRGRTGGVLPGVAPSNAYPCADGAEVVIAANADGVFARLCDAIGRPELADDDRFATHLGRGDHMAELDDLLAAWTAQRPGDEVIAVLEAAGVPVGRIYTAADMLHDAHFLARDMVLRHRAPQGWEVPMAGIVPKFSRTPGAVDHTGPRLGEDTLAVLTELAGVTDTELAELSEAGVISATAKQP
jgi:formyl-CoA transferase/succinyl-CoA--D-citramalate CoA-transferase